MWKLSPKLPVSYEVDCVSMILNVGEFILEKYKLFKFPSAFTLNDQSSSFGTLNYPFNFYFKYDASSMTFTLKDQGILSGTLNYPFKFQSNI